MPLLDWRRVALGSWSIGIGACTSATEVDIRLLLPEDTTPLEVADNANFTLQPDGFSESISVDGTDFTFAIELDPDAVERSLSVYLARQETLLGYGSSLPFRYGPAVSLGLRVLIGYPGRVANFPQSFALPDASSIAASFDGQHMLVLASDRSTLFVDGHTYAFENAASWPSDVAVPPAHDGVFLSEGSAIVTRLWWDPNLRAMTFDLRDNTWVDRPVVGDAGADRAAAAFVHVPEQRVAWLLGGGMRTDVARLDLSAGSQISTASEPNLVLDGPRQGAQGLLVSAVQPPELVLVGGTDPLLPRVYFVDRGLALGPAEDWQDLQCAPVDRDAAAVARIVCAGGIRAGQPSADALVIELSVSGAPIVTPAMNFLSEAMPDVRWLHDNFALFAQSGATLNRFDRRDLSRLDQPSPLGRTRGGSVLDLATGVTMIIGGALDDGYPANRWQIFAPSLSPRTP